MDRDEIEQQEQAAMDAALEGTPTETPEAPAAEPTPAPEPEIEYAQLTKAEYEQLRSRAALVEEIKAAQEKSFGTAFGKIGGIERRLQEIASAPSVEIDQADIDALKDDFPPLAAALQKVKSLRAIPTGGIDPSRLDELVQQRIAPALDRINVTVEQTVEKRLLTRQHPDWQTVVATPEFAAFTQTLPATEQQQLANSWDSDFIGGVLTRFKTAKPAKQTTSRFDAAVAPRGTGGTKSNVQSEEEAFEATLKSR